MLKALTSLIVFASFLPAQALVPDEHLSALDLFADSIDNTVAGAKNTPSLIALEAQLAALKSAKLIHISEEESRYSVAIVGWLAVTSLGAYATSLAGGEIYQLNSLKNFPLRRLMLTTLVVGGATYAVALLANKTAITMVLTEEQLINMIKGVEAQIYDLKRH